MDPITTSTEVSSLFTSVPELLTSGTFLLLLLLPSMGTFILTTAAKWKILAKADMYGWAALIPFYGRYCFYDITWDNGWLSLASYIPGLSYVFKVITMVKLSCRFDKNSVFALGLVLFEPVFLAILGFDESEFAYYE